jgi:hypothetical protein
MTWQLDLRLRLFEVAYRLWLLKVVQSLEITGPRTASRTYGSRYGGTELRLVGWGPPSLQSHKKHLEDKWYS